MYEKTNWVDGETPLSAQNMNKIENQLEQNTNDIAGIIESGSNSNGSWVKFSDGTMMCRGIVTTGDVTFTAWGSLYQYEVPSVSFPSSFIDVPHIDFTSNNPSTEYNYCLEAGTYQTTKSETGIMRVVRPLATTGRIQIKWTAIGKWK